MPHLEFTVDGPPVSYQTKDRANLNAWKGLIRAEAAKHWSDKAPLLGKLKCIIYNFTRARTRRSTMTTWSSPSGMR